ncbi:MAG: GDP-fucose synthetase [Candidatus Yanofskybacteria bacterium RIFCSPHIGHO2_02_FULL_41_11]|uniref:GDP-L-fucose synthase n=1 Tax=Candidatus Yanofskybacteria bacterium RIFCSPHIGHO2_02_FULL_41_11 TaxID=1802675 RepID=A0A1F8FEH4_9BACT|nr:MAG: GDP-fucose synthetase [Candidatus Yanofskybacteria bacterium RIFCSPHIGHO2_02_FULL_41_11]
MRNNPSIQLKTKKILVTGGTGFLGSFVVQKLLKRGVSRKNISIPRSKELDLRKWENCVKAVKNQDIIIHLAAVIGGIGYNQKIPGRMFYDNLMMGAQLMEAARQADVEKFIAIGTICAYPKFAPIPFAETSLWHGYPEETNAPYGLAKKMLLVQAQAYRQQYDFNAIYLLPVNLYGPGDNFNPQSSHVIPALIKKVSDAKKIGQKHIDVWGTGKASREFLYVKDCAEGIVLATEKYDRPEPVNLGANREIKIKDLVRLVCKLMDFKGEIHWDKTKPDGQPRRMVDATLAKKEFGFKAKTDFEKGLKKTIEWYKNQ